MTDSTCFCDYPVVLRRARKAFSVAHAQLKAAEEKHGPWLKQRREDELLRRPKDKYGFAWSYHDFSGWAQLRDLESRYRRLSDLANRVTELRLTRVEIEFMARAERERFDIYWDEYVEAAQQIPLPPIPEPAAKQEPYAWIEVPKTPRARPSIWSSIFG